MSTIGSGRNELTELMSYHILCDIHRNVSSSVVNCDCMTNHLREDCGAAGPGLDDCLFARLVPRGYLFQ